MKQMSYVHDAQASDFAYVFSANHPLFCRVPEKTVELFTLETRNWRRSELIEGKP